MTSYISYRPGYIPILKINAMITAIGPVIKREYNTAGTPYSIVSGSASPNDKPTGMKSHPTCASIANKAGNAY